MGRQVSAHFYFNVENVVEPVVAGMGYELVDLQASVKQRVFTSEIVDAIPRNPMGKTLKPEVVRFVNELAEATPPFDPSVH